MTLNDVVVALFLLFLGYLFWQHINASRIARRAAMLHCEKSGVQLLDQNVTLQRLRFRRSGHSLFSIERVYSFEFSSVGDYRYKGSIRLRGQHVQAIELAPFKTEFMH